MAEEDKIETIAGPNGEAEIYEIYEDNQPLTYTVHFKGSVSEIYKTLGEAYLEAGRLAGVRT